MWRAELEAGDLVAILSDYQLDWVEVHAFTPVAVDHTRLPEASTFANT
jgi:hypothetical protein